MKSAVFSELSEAFDRILRLNCDIIEAWESDRSAEFHFGAAGAPGRGLWIDLRRLADKALDEGCVLRPFYLLGVASGEYDLKLWDEVAPRGDRSANLPGAREG